MSHPETKPIRLQTYDYSTQGAYFLTAVTHARRRLFSTIHDGVATPTRWGQTVLDVWNELPGRYPVVLDEIAVMPDHVHCILFLSGKDPHANPGYYADKDHRRQRRVMLLFKVMGYWKSTVSKRMREAGFRGDVWGGHDWDRIVRDEAELNRIREYIRKNPIRWWEKYGLGKP